MPVILHIIEHEAWSQAQRQGVYTPSSLQDEGFIHCSTPQLVVEVANFMFKGRSGLLLLCIDTAKVQAQIRYEQAGGQERWIFPHIYGALNLDAVVNTVESAPESDGSFVLPQGFCASRGSN